MPTFLPRTPVYPARAASGGFGIGGGGGSVPSAIKPGVVTAAGFGGSGGGGGSVPSATEMMEMCGLPVAGGKPRVSTPIRIKFPNRNKKTSVLLNFMISSISIWFGIGDPVSCDGISICEFSLGKCLRR